MFYLDIDIVNSHPNILYQSCRQNNIECDTEEKIFDVQNSYNLNKDCAKKLLAQLMYYGSIESWCSQNNINNDVIQLNLIKKIKNKFNLIGEIIISYNEKLVKSVQKYKSIKNDNYNETS